MKIATSNIIVVTSLQENVSAKIRDTETALHIHPSKGARIFYDARTQEIVFSTEDKSNEEVKEILIQ